MKIRVFGCKKFSRLISDRVDRDLGASEVRFVSRHRDVCPTCRRSERSSDRSLNMLRAATLEPEVAPMFEDRVIRRLKVQNVRESLSYWTPALLGAGIACVALFVALHLAATPSQLGRSELSGDEARRYVAPKTPPKLELSRIPEFRR